MYSNFENTDFNNKSSQTRSRRTRKRSPGRLKSNRLSQGSKNSRVPSIAERSSYYDDRMLPKTKILKYETEDVSQDEMFNPITQMSNKAPSPVKMKE